MIIRINVPTPTKTPTITPVLLLFDAVDGGLLATVGVKSGE